jgi:tetratricopeptide (TPR) repeat protein
MMKAATPIYEEALRLLLPANEPGNKWRRVTIDQAAMAYGISGDIQKTRRLLNATVQADPAYPLNYYNLACADAEEGNAADAKLHLQQAFDWKANVIPGENLPDPTQDDSLLKLKDDKAFWSFVEDLKKSR